ncbi:hypothetical protein Tco_1207690, partial [Tanacetum coccineum]
MPPPSFSNMVPFYKQVLGFTMELKTSSSFKTTGLLQPWQTLCKIFSKCLTTRVTGWDHPPRSTHLTPPATVPNVDKADEMILQDTLQVSLAEHKSHEEQEARENVALVDEHLASEEIEKMVEITKETDVVDITNVVIPVNVNDEDEEITDEVYKLKRKEKGKIVEETRNSPIPTPNRSPRIHTNIELHGRYGYLFAHLRARFMPRKSSDTLADNLHDVMVETLPTMVDKHIKEQVPEQVRNQVPRYVAEGLILERRKAKEEMETGTWKYWLALQMKFERNTVPQTACRTPAVRIRDQDDPHDDAHPEVENSAKWQKTSEYEAYVSGESSSGQVFQEEQAPS